MELEELLKVVPLGGEAAFPEEEIDARQTRLRALLDENGIDLYLTSGAENIFYLSGQQTPGYYVFQCLGVPATGEPFLVIRELEAYNARANSYLERIHGYGDGTSPAEALAGAIEAQGWKGRRIAIDRGAWYLTVNIFRELENALGVLLDGSGLTERLRRVKSPLEMAAMERAAAENDAGMLAGLRATRAGVTENDIAAVIMHAAIAAGSEYVGMEPFVTSGPRSGIPHSTWRRRRIRPGDVVVLETSACHHRYHAAMFRTIAVGDVPQKARDWYAVCLEALDAAMQALRPGNPCSLPHERAQAVIDRHGATEGYRKRTGYSMGISFAPDWGEGNIMDLNKGRDIALEPGMVFHVPITLRDYAKFTVAASETIAVTGDGARALGHLPRDLVEA